MNAKLRYARKNEVYASDIEEILESYEAGNTRIIWRAMSREQQQYGNRSRWEIQSRLDETDAWQSAGELYICTACGEIYDIIAGNIYDDMEHCPTCNAELND